MRSCATGLVLTLAALTAAGHLGATLTHGEGYLTEFAPGAAPDADRRRLRRAGAPRRSPARSSARPSTRRWCGRCCSAIASSCHARRRGPRRPRPRHARGDPQGRRSRPGRDARPRRSPASWCAACGSRPITRTSCRRADSGRSRPRTPGCCDGGSTAARRFEQPLAELDVPPDVLPVIEARLGPLSRGGPTIPPVSLAAPDPARLAAIRDRGVDLRPIADGSPFLEARVSRTRAGRGRRTRRQPRAARAARPVADAGRHGDLRRRLPRHRAR